MHRDNLWKGLAIQCEPHDVLSEKKENIFESYPRLEVCMFAQSCQIFATPEV